MKRQVLILAAGLSILPSRAMSDATISCVVASNYQMNQVIPEGVEVDGAAICSNLDTTDAQLSYSWAPPISSFNSFGAFTSDSQIGNIVGGVQVVETGNCCNGTDPTCVPPPPTPQPCDPSFAGCNNFGSRANHFNQVAADDGAGQVKDLKTLNGLTVCEPTDPDCGKDGKSLPILNPRKYRDLNVYKRFKRVFVIGKNKKAFQCSLIAIIQVPGIQLFAQAACFPNCQTAPALPPPGPPGGPPLPAPPPPGPPACVASAGADAKANVGGSLSGVTSPVPSNPPAEEEAVVCANPVNVATGSMWHQVTDFQIAGRTAFTGIPLVRTYTADIVPGLAPGGFGSHWHYTYETHLQQARTGAAQDIDWYNESGSPFHFTLQSDGSFQAPAGVTSVLSFVTDHFELRNKNNSTYFFHSLSVGNPGLLYQVKDPHGESVSFTYNSLGQLARISAPFAGVVSFSYNRVGRISTVVRNRDNLTYTYDYDSKGRLFHVTDFQGRVYTYSYIDDKPTMATANLLASITDPLGRVLKFTYDAQGRSNNQYEPGGGVWSFKYGDHQTTVTAPNGAVNEYNFDANYQEIKHVDPLGGVKNKTWNGGFLKDIQKDFGGTPIWSYDAKGNITSLLRPSDQTPHLATYDPTFNKPTLAQPPTGAPIQYTIDPNNGDMLSMSRGGLTVSYTYDSFGNLLSTNNGVTTYSDQRDANGLLTKVFDLHNPETRSYDSRGRMTTSQFLSGRTVSYTYNNDDQILTTTDSAARTSGLLCAR